MKVISWRGWSPATDQLWIGLDVDVWGQWEPIFSTTPRAGSTAVVTDVTIGERTIGAEFGNDNSARSIDESWRLALQRLNPLDTSEGTLVIAFNDTPATHWSCQARLSLAGPTSEGTTDTFDIAWETTDPCWHAVDVTTETDVVTPATITNPTFASDATGWTKGSDPTNVTSAFSRDAGVYFDAAGSGKVVVSANTGSGGDLLVLNDDEHACSAGAVVQVKAAVRTTNGKELDGNGVDVWPYVAFYDVSDSFLGAGTHNGVGGQVDNVWETLFYATGTAPASTAYCKIGVIINIGAGDTGTVYFDAFEFVTGPYTSTAFDVGGSAPTNLKLTATPSGNFPQAIYARTFTITNNGARTLHNHPVEVDLGDNSGGSTSGTYWALLRDGKPQPCQVSDYDSASSSVWLIIDHLPIGATASYTLLVSDQTVLPATAYDFNSYTQPAFDIGYTYATTTSGSSSTVTQIPTGLGTEVDRWIGGTMEILSGAQAGTTIEITDSTTTTVTHAALGGGALASGVSVKIKMSSNDRWIYPVRKTERNESAASSITKGSTRGLWWLASGQKRPNDFSMEVPGAWEWTVYYGNKDEYSQSWCLAFDPGGGADYVAIFDVERTWQGGKTRGREQGFDGVAIFTGVPITDVRFDYQLRNPNSLAMLVLGSRQENGATEWTHEYEDATATATLTNYAIQDVALEPDTYGVGLFLTPNGVDEIGEGWAGDNGTATGATPTTLSDSNKEWTPDQFIGGTVQIVSGTGAPQTRPITDNGPDSVTVASWTNGTPDTTSRYVIRNREYYAIGRNHTYLHLELNPSAIEISSVSPETEAFVLYRDILIDDDQRVAIAPETTGRFIVLLDDESLVVDGEAMRAYVAETSTGDELRIVPPLAYSVLDIESDGTRRLSKHWLRVYPGSHTISLASDESGVSCSVDVEFNEAVYA